MVKVSFNFRKEYLFLLVLIALSAFAFSQPNVFGHQVSEIAGLQSVLPQVEVGEEIYVGSYSMSNNYQAYNDIHLKTPTGLANVRVLVTGTSGTTFNTANCNTLVLDSSNNFRVTCDNTGITSFKWTGAECDTPANVDWISFDLYGYGASGNNLMKGAIESNGTEKLAASLCDDSSNAGSASFDVYATPYVVRVGNTRINPYVIGNTSAGFS